MNRSAARRKAQQDAQRNDMKQHADKLIQGFQKLGDSHAKRAIWELFQNALDLVTDNAYINIEQTNSAFIFRHNGEPFDDHTLNCLIKQVSSKTAGNNDEQVGQYGTGWIATHSFGRKIFLSGSMKNEDRYIKLNRFEIDRTPKTAPELIDKLIAQQDAAFDLIEKGDYDQRPAPYTEFEYEHGSTQEKECAKAALTSLPQILPFVMTLNPKIKKVSVKDAKGKTTIYERIDYDKTENISKTTIKINNQPVFIYSIEDKEEDNIVVLLPFENELTAFSPDPNLPRLFLYYPLIGTEQLGINFIIHCQRFSPTEQRDGLYLNSNNEQVQQDEAENRRLIDKASNMIFNLVQSKAIRIKNPIHLSQINFKVNSDNELLNEYFQELKAQWIDAFKDFPLIETTEGNLQPLNAAFIDLELLQDEPSFDAIHSLAAKYWKNLPKKSLIREWTRIIKEWGLESIIYIKIIDLIIEIEKEGSLQDFSDPADLKVFFQYLLTQGNGDIFNQHHLLPNIKGNFRQLTSLAEPIAIPAKLIEIANTLMPDIPEKFIHPNFKFDLVLSTYNRKKFASDITAALTEEINDNDKGKDFIEEYLNKLIEYCKIAAAADSVSVPSKMIKLICQYYEQNDELIPIPLIKDNELDTRTAQKKMLRLFLNDLANEESVWVKQHIAFLRKVLEIGPSYNEYEDLFKTLPVFPNQYHELIEQSKLKIEEDMPEEIKDLYDKVVKPDTPIRSSLILHGFEQFLANKEKKTGRNLGEEIESRFFENGHYTNINDMPFKDQILEIIQKMFIDNHWTAYFSLLASKRANIIVDRVSDEKIKDNIISIVSLDADKIKKISALAHSPHFDRIIQLGAEAVEEEIRQKTDFQFKTEIGKKIENLIREK